MNNSLTLLRTMMRSSGRRNIIKYSQDKSKRRSATASLVGSIVLGFFFAVLVGLISFAMAHYGYAEAVPDLVATVISVMSLILTLFKANGYLYGFKGYDMLIAMPFSVRTVVIDRFLLMYLSDLRWSALISIGALVGYIAGAKPGIIIVVFWVILTPFISLLPSVVAVLISAGIAAAGSRFRYKRQAQIVLTFVLVIPLFFIRYIVEYLFKNDKVDEVMETSSQTLAGISKVIPSVGWFDNAINKSDIVSFILLIVISTAVIVVTVLLVSATYKQINSRLMNAGFRKRLKSRTMEYKQRSMVRSIAFNDYKLVMGSTTSAVNLGMGAVLSILIGLVLPFISVQNIVRLMANGYPVDISPFRLLWPTVVYFFVGMVPTTTASPSLEGKNYWILQSLPVTMMTVYKGKMLFNLILNLIPGLFATLTGFISMRAAWYEYLLGIVMITSMCLFSTTYGMRCGIRHQKLDWENEIEVVKKGTAVALYLLPNMFATMALWGVMGVLCWFVGGVVSAVGVSFIYLILAAVCYLSVQRLVR